MLTHFCNLKPNCEPIYEPEFTFFLKILVTYSAPRSLVPFTFYDTLAGLLCINSNMATTNLKVAAEIICHPTFQSRTLFTKGLDGCTIPPFTEP